MNLATPLHRFSLSAVNGRPSPLARIARRLARTKCEYETVRTLYYDLKYGGYCGREKLSPFTSRGANGTQSVEYWMLDVLFKKRSGLTIQPSDVLVDVGCGWGRVINFWLMQGYRNSLVGVELDPEVAEPTRQRLRRFDNVSIITGDIVDNIPSDATIFWLYNPFNEIMMAACKRKREALVSVRRNVTLLYDLCHQAHLFENDANWRVEDLGKLHHMRAALITMTDNSNPACHVTKQPAAIVG